MIVGLLFDHKGGRGYLVREGLVCMQLPGGKIKGANGGLGDQTRGRGEGERG